VSQVWVYGDQALAIMNFMGRSTTPFEIRVSYEMPRRGRSNDVSSNVSLVHQTYRKTKQTNSQVVMLEFGIGFVVPLRAA
jgi:hypothetical protein